MIPYIDLHCDTLLYALQRQKDSVIELPDAMVDVGTLQAGGCAAQCFAIFMPPKKYQAELHLPPDDVFIQMMAEVFTNSVERSPLLCAARSAADWQKNRAENKISAILTIEDARAVDGRMEVLEQWREMGVRLASLTWNDANCFGAPNSDDPDVMQTGLTPFGCEAVEYMPQLGILPDVSHLSDGGFWDVERLCKGPFVASHSNCRALTPHSRNLTDEMLRAIGAHGGVAGLNLYPDFLRRGADSGLEQYAAHARHMVDAAGIESVAIGTDFDGMPGGCALRGAEEMPRVFDALHDAGFSWDEIEKIAWKNAARVLF